MSIYSRDYIEIQGKPLKSYPIISVRMVDGERKSEPINAITDSGYDGSFLISKKLADEFEIPEDNKRTDFPSSIITANLKKVRINKYELKIEIGETLIPTFVTVPAKNVNLLWDAFVGRQIIDSYNVLLKGRTNPKKLEIV